MDTLALTHLALMVLFFLTVLVIFILGMRCICRTIENLCEKFGSVAEKLDTLHQANERNFKILNRLLLEADKDMDADDTTTEASENKDDKEEARRIGYLKEFAHGVRKALMIHSEVAKKRRVYDNEKRHQAWLNLTQAWADFCKECEDLYPGEDPKETYKKLVEGYKEHALPDHTASIDNYIDEDDDF